MHFGLGPNGDQSRLACPRRPTGAADAHETLRCLFLRHRSLIAFIDGHEHLNRIVPYARAVGGPSGGFWEITTASHIDWPQQSRLLDLLDNRDGTLSLFSTVLDHTAALSGRRAAGGGDRPAGASASLRLSRAK